MNEYTIKNYEVKKQVASQLNAFDGFKFELEPLIEGDRETINLVDSGAPISVNFNDYEKKYRFYLDYKMPYVNYDTYKVVADKHQAPQMVGVLSASKIKAWVEYLTTIYSELVIISQEREERINAFLERAKQSGVMVYDKAEFSHRHGGMSRNGIDYHFEIYENGYIQEEIKVNYAASGLDSFLKLSDNKYISKKD